MCACASSVKEMSNHEDKEEKEAGEEKAKEEGEGEAVYQSEEDVELKTDEEEKDGGDPLRKDGEEGFHWPRERVCHTHERAIPIQETVETLDITEEGKWLDTQGRTFGHIRSNAVNRLLQE